jgi:hypothetical protein
MMKVHSQNQIVDCFPVLVGIEASNVNLFSSFGCCTITISLSSTFEKVHQFIEFINNTTFVKHIECTPSIKITWSLTFVINLCAISTQSLYYDTWVCNLSTIWWSSYLLFWSALPFSFPYKQSWLSPFSPFSFFVIQLLLHLGDELVVCFVLSCLLWLIGICVVRRLYPQHCVVQWCLRKVLSMFHLFGFNF